MESDAPVEGSSALQTSSSTPVSVTPKLSKKERKALLASGKSFEKSLKNVIANPHQTFWPSVTDTKMLKVLLTGPLEKCRLTLVKLPLATVKAMAPAERRKARKEAAEQIEGAPEAHRLRSMLAIGVNAVSRVLERQEADAVIISADVEPRLMVQHLIALAARQAAIIVAPGVRQLTNDTFGVKTCALAFKKCAEGEANDFSAAVEEIKRLAATVAKPPHVAPALRDEVPAEEEPAPDSEEEEVKQWQSRQVGNWHLPKPASGKRAFYPSGASEQTIRAEHEGEFIRLGDVELCEVDKSAYLPLRVNRVKPNKDRPPKKKAKFVSK